MDELLQILVDEHKLILKVIDAIEKECKELESGKEINTEFFTNAIDFIRNYADRFHHAKEEDLLFIELNKEGVLTHCNPTEQMIFEHEQGREYVKNLEIGVDEKDKNKVLENANGYAALLQEHIDKEDNILYPMADEALSDELKKTLLEKFRIIAKESDVSKYVSFVEGLK